MEIYDPATGKVLSMTAGNHVATEDIDTVVAAIAELVPGRRGWPCCRNW
jgi:hypothetical protein